MLKVSNMRFFNKIKNFFFPKNRRVTTIIIYGFILGVLFFGLADRVIKYTSSNEFCMACHVHPHAEETWRLSPHYNTRTGTVTNCADCHLPPPGTLRYLASKTEAGIRDVYGWLFKDPDKINWEAKRFLEAAVRHTYQESCIACHQNHFPVELSQEGMLAHIHYQDNKERDDLNCLNCHLHVGHYRGFDPKAAAISLEPMDVQPAAIFTSSTQVTEFSPFVETIPGTSVSFRMLPIPGGSFQMGSPEREPGRGENEGPQREVEVSPFFMAEVEVTWDMYLAFFRETVSEGRNIADMRAVAVEITGIDAISGPTPPWGAPDQGWGWGNRPAITMTHHAAQIFCQWLSKKTGKTYRLPTEAEWEFAARGGTSTPYFFEGNPRRFTNRRFWNQIFGPDTTNINSFVIFGGNSRGKTQTPEYVRPNPFGLKNMLGNVWEFCSDFYASDVFLQFPEGEVVKNPKGPSTGTERVIRGGSFRSDAFEARSATRSHTRHDNWMRTDPQVPKSIWWYSDVVDVGFRVVMEWTPPNPTAN